MNYTIKSERYTALISDEGAELVSLKSAAGEEFIWQGAEGSWNRHAPLLFPICGRIKDKSYVYRNQRYNMDAHGFARCSTFDVLSHTESSITLSLSQNEETLAIYPFAFTLTATYSLEEGALTAAFTVKNDSGEIMPYMFGWHPGFVLPTAGGADINDYYIDFAGLESLDLYPLQNGPFARPYPDAYPLTNGRVLIDEEYLYSKDTMIFLAHNNSCTLGSDKNNYRVEMSWTDNLPVLAVWKYPRNVDKYLCLEPWTQMPADGETEENFETRKMERLEVGKSATYKYSVKVTT